MKCNLVGCGWGQLLQVKWKSGKKDKHAGAKGRKTVWQEGGVVKGGFGGKVVLGGESRRQQTQNSALNWFFLVAGRAPLLQHSSLRFQNPGKTDRDLEGRVGFAAGEGNNRAVCPRARRDVSRKELVVTGASGGRAPH